MAFIADASAVLAWVLPDERDPIAVALLERSLDEELVVPAHWSGEVANGLLVAERRKRLTTAKSNELIAHIGDLEIAIDDLGAAAMFDRVLPLARTHGLTIYDALYLELAQRTGLDFATFDKALAEAAKSVGLRVIA